VNQNLARHELAEDQLRAGLDAYADAADTVATLPARAELTRMLAICLHDLGRYAESETAFRRAVALHRRAYPELELTRVQLVTDLATAIQAQGRQDEALRMLREAVALAEDLGDDGASEVAYIRNLRGYIEYQVGRYREALDDMTAALAVQRGLYEGDNVDLVSSLNNVGGMNLELGRLEAAESHIAESKAMLERIYQGDDHPSISRAIIHLGRIALARGDTATAIARLERGYDLTLAQLGPDHPSTWSAELSLAEVRHCQGRDAEARRLYESNLAAWLETQGPLYFKTLTSRREYGRFLRRTGELAAAAREFETVIAAYEQLGQTDHPRLLETRVDLADVKIARGDTTGLGALVSGVVPKLVRVFGPETDIAARARDVAARAGS
jgi:tetratricopeptide (TPR) repeat protein